MIRHHCNCSQVLPPHTRLQSWKSFIEISNNLDNNILKLIVLSARVRLVQARAMLSILKTRTIATVNAAEIQSAEGKSRD